MENYQCIIISEAENEIRKWPDKHRNKVNDFLRLLEERSGVLEEPYSRHLKGKIRELRVDFGKSRYRILYALIPNKKIIILLAFRKSTKKTPGNIIERAEKLLNLYQQYTK